MRVFAEQSLWREDRVWPIVLECATSDSTGILSPHTLAVVCRLVEQGKVASLYIEYTLTSFVQASHPLAALPEGLPPVRTTLSPVG
eukprot:7418886-Pyramimonas_sp.AAC.1